MCIRDRLYILPQLNEHITDLLLLDSARGYDFLKQAITNFPNSPIFYITLIGHYQQQKDFENADKCLIKAIALFPDEPEFSILVARQGN